MCRGLDDFVELDEPLYALFYVWLGFTGAGAVSLDYLVSAALGVSTGNSSSALGAPAAPVEARRS